MSAPVTLRYEGEGEFRAMSGYWASQCDKAFTVGQFYRITEHYERSNVSHNHFFATISDAHGSLPDHMLAEYPTTEHLRKKALIHKGYADERSIVCASKAEALRMAAFVRPMDEYAVVVPSEAVVRVYTAQSQSRRAMGAKAFQESKQAVLDFIDDLLGVERGATAKSSGYQHESEPSEAPRPAPDAGRAAAQRPFEGCAADPSNSEGELDAGNDAGAPNDSGSVGESTSSAAATLSSGEEKVAGEVANVGLSASPAADNSYAKAKGW